MAESLARNKKSEVNLYFISFLVTL